MNRRNARRAAAVTCVALVFFVRAPIVWAYACVTTSCAPHCESPVTYKLGLPSADLGGATQMQVQTGMEAWTKPACSALKTQFAGTTTVRAGSGNGIIEWIESGWPSGSGTIGVTTSRISRGCISSSMVMNGVNFRWVAGNTNRGEVNAFTIIAHEGGHYFGLGHSSLKSAVMTPSYAGGIVAIGADDEAGICKIYPGGGGGGIPSGTGGVAGSGGGAGTGGAGTGGAGGATGMDKGLLCAACAVAADCSAGDCLRNDETGEYFCGQPCGGGCPSGFQCVSINGNTASKQCVPSTGTCKGITPPVVMAGTGGVAGNGGVSGSGGMGGASPTGGNSSTGGNSGMGGTSGGTAGQGGGLFMPSCRADDDCGANERCNSSSSCEPIEPVTVADGEHCEINEDCHSQLCIEHDKDSFCSRLCASNADCVSGFSCANKGGERVCLPIGQSAGAGKVEPDGPVVGSAGCRMAGRADTTTGHGGLVLLFALAWAIRRRKRR
ncbi:MAG: matrixin family metalloprotease [Deltaproteobacteria bacterium]|nr:matrixin family metalloprotease [Deltaproteobacteria bacterium]